MQSSVDRRATSPPTQSTTVKPGDNDKSKIALVALQDENRALKNVIDRLRSESKDSRKRCGELEHTVASYASMQEEIQVIHDASFISAYLFYYLYPVIFLLTNVYDL